MDTVNRGTRSSMWHQLSFFAALLANMSTTTKKKSDEKAVGIQQLSNLWKLLEGKVSETIFLNSLYSPAFLPVKIDI